jgi:hypothetical protein
MQRFIYLYHPIEHMATPRHIRADLHVHPFLDRYTLVDVVKAMDNKFVNAVGLSHLDADLPEMHEQARLFYPGSMTDKTGIRLPNGKYLFISREYNTAEGLHLLTVGYSMGDATPTTEIKRIIDRSLENNALVILDHPFAANDWTKTAGHIPERLEATVRDLCREYKGDLCLEWNAYCRADVRRFLRYGLNSFGHKTDYHDVNMKALQLANDLRGEEITIPVIAVTDLHARTAEHLKHIGTAHIDLCSCAESPSELLQTMKKKIQAGHHTNEYTEIGMGCLMKTFALPVLFDWVYRSPRAEAPQFKRA